MASITIAINKEVCMCSRLAEFESDLDISTSYILEMVKDKENITILNNWEVMFDLSICIFIFETGRSKGYCQCYELFN